MARVVVAALALLAAAPAAQAVTHPRPVDVPILLYHRIGPLDPALPPITKRLTVTPADFDAQMEWLRRHRFHAITQRQLLAALERGTPLPPRPVMITFDDGYRDVLWNAAPELARLHMPATEYVITGRLSGPDVSFLTWPELQRLQHLGVAIGSHTVTHADLPALSSAAAFAELVDSERALEQHLGYAVRWFAYPYGAEDARIVGLVRRAGYELAVTTRGGFQQDPRRPLELHRNEVLDSAGPGGLAFLLGSG